MNIRPNPPSSVSDANLSALGQGINANNIVAGTGIRVDKGTGGTVISLLSDISAQKLTFQGVYNFSSSYQIGDVVFVDPNVVYKNQDNVTMSWSYESGSDAPICAGLFTAIQFVPGMGQDVDMLTASIPYFTALGQTITSDFSNQFRHYDCNVYYPVYPVWSTSSITYATKSGYTTVANQIFWSPLMPMMKTSYCSNGVTSTLFVAGVISGSTFSSSFLPYP